MDEILNAMVAFEATSAARSTSDRKRPISTFEEELGQWCQHQRLQKAHRLGCPNLQCPGGGSMLETRDGDWACSVCGACGPRVYHAGAEWRVFAEDNNKEPKVRASTDHAQRSSIEASVFSAIAKASKMEEVLVPRPEAGTQPPRSSSLPYKAKRRLAITNSFVNSTSGRSSPRSPLVTANA
jgi:hypothetical protein